MRLSLLLCRFVREEGSRGEIVLPVIIQRGINLLVVGVVETCAGSRTRGRFRKRRLTTLLAVGALLLLSVVLLLGRTFARRFGFRGRFCFAILIDETFFVVAAGSAETTGSLSRGYFFMTAAFVS